MLTDAIRRKAAESLIQAENERKPIVQLSTTWPQITIDGYKKIYSRSVLC